MSTIRINNLCKSYGKYVALDGLSVEIPDGCVFGLLGPNGAGKTTTFKCMLGLAFPQTGSVLFDGKPLSPEMLANVAYVPEKSVLYDWMTVADHVEMQRRTFKSFDTARANELLDMFSIEPRKKTRALSKGMRTAVQVSLAIARRTEVLILDEPTTGLDPINQRHVLNLIINESARGATIIFSSHQIGQVERAAERIAVVDHGHLVLEGAVDDLKAGRKIVEGIFPTETYALNGIATDRRIARVDASGRIVRLLATESAAEFVSKLEALGATGVRIVDLNLEDIFLYAVSPQDATADVVAEESK
jgi:ABC-2 type transport system ATP-binding protein